MRTRPLLLVCALAGGDYLLWNWSSDGHSATLALISGLALAPLIIALLWLSAVCLARTVLTRPLGMQRSGTAAGKGGRKTRALRLRRRGRSGAPLGGRSRRGVLGARGLPKGRSRGTRRPRLRRAGSEGSATLWEQDLPAEAGSGSPSRRRGSEKIAA